MKRLIPTLFCLAIIAFSYSVVAQDAARPVLIESFSGTWCTYCFGAGMALDRIHANTSKDEVLVVVYHISDEYSIPFGQQRYDFYQVAGCPTAWFNGVVSETGGSSFREGGEGIARVLNIFADWIEQEQERIPKENPFELQLFGSVGPENPEMTLVVSATQPCPSPLNAVFLIVEDHVAVPEENLAFFANKQPMYSSLARTHVGTKNIDMSLADSVTIHVASEDFVPHESVENLRPVVFLQNSETGEILAATGVFTDSNPSSVIEWCMHQ